MVNGAGPGMPPAPAALPPPMSRTTLAPTRLDWYADAACRAAGTDLFFPVSESGAAAAKAICESCPVRDACLEQALSMRPAPDGVWGGLTAMERHRLVRRRQKAARKERGAAA